MHRASSRIGIGATEQSNARSAHLDAMSSAEIVELFVTEEERVTEALAACRPQLAAAVELVSAAMVAGGRLFYVGAGTSGRLGVLDASEIPPTFGAPPELVQGIIAGGGRPCSARSKARKISLPRACSRFSNARARRRYRFAD